MKKSLRSIYKVKCLVALIATLFSFTYSNAQGNLLITPKRVVFEGSRRSEELNLANIGKDTATFSISVIQIRMKEDGSFENILSPDSAQLFADKNLRFFPRSVTLAPNEAQSVKVQLVNTADLKPGEYRSHLYFRGTPPPRPLGEKEQVTDSTSLSVRLTPIFGISMPVIIRVGENNASIKLTDIAVKGENDSTNYVQMTFNRSGNMSVYGDVFIDYIDQNGNETRVGLVKGLSVYTPNTKRHFSMLLDKSKRFNYAAGKLRITYQDQSIRPVIYAQETISAEGLTKR